MKVMIVGAGIGGLTAAIALRRAGVGTTVFERAGELREVGAGLLLAANAVRALDELGLSEKVRRLGTPASAARILSWRGETLTDVPADELEKRLGTPSAAVHRADLQGLLLRELGEENVRLGATCSSFEQDEESVTALVVDGSEERGDALIGADGLNSTIRTSLFGGEKPRYAGYTACRAVVEPSHELLPWGVGFESWGSGARFGCAHIGGGRVYWFATRNAPEGAKDGPVGSSSGPKATLMKVFGGWHQPVAAYRGNRRCEIRRDDLYDREPLDGPWGEGRVTLLGDAGPVRDPEPRGRERARPSKTPWCWPSVYTGGRKGWSAVGATEVRGPAPGACGLDRPPFPHARVVIGQLENPILCRLRNAALRAVPATDLPRRFEWVMLYKERSAVR